MIKRDDVIHCQMKCNKRRNDTWANTTVRNGDTSGTNWVTSKCSYTVVPHSVYVKQMAP